MPPGVHSGHRKGGEHCYAKLSAWDVAAIRLLLEESVPLLRISKAFWISCRQLRRIRDGQGWRI